MAKGKGHPIRGKNKAGQLRAVFASKALVSSKGKGGKRVIRKGTLADRPKVKKSGISDSSSTLTGRLNVGGSSGLKREAFSKAGGSKAPAKGVFSSTRAARIEAGKARAAADPGAVAARASRAQGYSKKQAPVIARNARQDARMRNSPELTPMAVREERRRLAEDLSKARNRLNAEKTRGAPVSGIYGASATIASIRGQAKKPENQRARTPAEARALRVALGKREAKAALREGVAVGSARIVAKNGGFGVTGSYNAAAIASAKAAGARFDGGSKAWVFSTAKQARDHARKFYSPPKSPTPPPKPSHAATRAARIEAGRAIAKPYRSALLNLATAKRLKTLDPGFAGRAGDKFRAQVTQLEKKGVNRKALHYLARQKPDFFKNRIKS